MKDTQRATKFVELGRYLCEAREGQYWRLEKLKSSNELLARRSESGRKGFYPIFIDEDLQAQRRLKKIGPPMTLSIRVMPRPTALLVKTLPIPRQHCR